MAVRYTWTAEKDAKNFKNHGVWLADGAEALKDPNGIIVFDQEHSNDEERFLWIGLSSKGILLVVFNNRENDTLCRVISARPATPKERRTYYAKNT